MEKNVLDYVVEKSEELAAAATCSAEAREAAKRFIEAAKDGRAAAEAPAYFAELEADIVTSDGLLAFAESEMGAKVFGAKAPEVAEHARQIKAAGAKYCDCPACAAVEAILAKKDELFNVLSKQ